MQSKHTLVGMLVDESGSMTAARQETIVAVNAYLEGLVPGPEAKDAPEIRVYGWTFDFFPGEPTLRPFCEGVSAAHRPMLRHYMPRGTTPLYDAVGLALGRLEVAAQPGEKVVLVVQTDGAENTSREFTFAQIKERLAAAQARGWEVVFLGADLIDTHAISSSLGLKAGSTMAYDKSSSAAAMRAAARSTMAYASGRAGGVSFGAQARAAAGEAAWASAAERARAAADHGGVAGNANGDSSGSGDSDGSSSGSAGDDGC